MTELLTFEPRQSATIAGTVQKPFEIRVVTSAQDRSEIFALRQRAYSALLGDTPCLQGNEYRDPFDNLATTVLFGAYDEGRLAGAMRLCFTDNSQSLAALPCAAYYPALLAYKQERRGSLLEVSRFSIEPEISNTSYRMTLYASLVRTALMAAIAADVAVILVATRAEMVRFYTYMLGFKTIGEPAIYPPGDLKIALLGGSLAQAQFRQRLQNRFFKISDGEIASLSAKLRNVLPYSRAA
jgi:N-acyl-L-homoserine lactone synthetase